MLRVTLMSPIYVIGWVGGVIWNSLRLGFIDGYHSWESKCLNEIADKSE
jgi:hypothetical protein